MNLGSSSATETVTVSYRICSLYDPTKPVKLGSTIPIRVQLCANDGTNLSSALLVLHAATVVKQSDTTGDTPIDSGNANPDNDFRYDATLGVTGGYIYNLSTRKLSTGSWRLTFSAADQLYTVVFQVK